MLPNDVFNIIIIYYMNMTDVTKIEICVLNNITFTAVHSVFLQSACN